ncbi:MAB_1171c family putative transporter [Kitasatospora sp. NPDC090091]|uniref:MAB_1171c family putative transporter n=1 Tax=Kitasatospora sp. NPDC090091 TaxID=3364081 RepID=UPI003824B947
MEAGSVIDDIIAKAIPATLVAIALWRLPGALRSGRAPRSLCITIGTLGLALGVGAVKVPLNDLYTGLPVVLRHLLGMTSTAYLLDYLYAVHGPGQRGRSRTNLPLAAAASTVMTLLFFLVLPRDVTPDPNDLLTDHQGEPAVIAYQAIFYAYLGTAMALGAKTFGTTRRAVPRGVVRAGVTSLTAGCALGTLYVAERLPYITIPGLGHSAALNLLFDLTVATSILLIIIGLVLPPLRGLTRYIRDQRTMWILHPLWSAIVTEFPNLNLGDRRSRLRELFTLGDLTIDVAHRAFVIRDAFMNLGIGTSQDPTSEAIRARAALQQKAAGELATNFQLAGHQELRAPSRDILWATNVARAYNKTSR